LVMARVLEAMLIAPHIGVGDPTSHGEIEIRLRGSRHGFLRTGCGYKVPAISAVDDAVSEDTPRNPQQELQFS